MTFSQLPLFLRDTDVRALTAWWPLHGPLTVWPTSPAYFVRPGPLGIESCQDWQPAAPAPTPSDPSFLREPFSSPHPPSPGNMECASGSWCHMLLPALLMLSQRDLITPTLAHSDDTVHPFRTLESVQFPSQGTAVSCCRKEHRL